MADISMLLIIFFLVTSQFMEDHGIRVEIPDAQQTADSAQSKYKQVDVDPRGTIIYRGRNVALPQLRDILAEQIRLAQKDLDRVVLLLASKARPVAEVVAVADVIAGVGGTVVLVSQEGAESADPGVVKARP
jgi:biopolymer transport protein ExbD